MKKHIAKEKKTKFVELRGIHGLSLDKISKELEISKTTAVNWEREFRGTIAELKEVHFELLIDVYSLGLEERLVRLKTLCSALRQEIDTRDFTDVSTEKLISLYLEVDKKLDHFIGKNTMGNKTNQHLGNIELFI